YRGHVVPSLRGAYVFADYNGRVFAGRERTGMGADAGTWQRRQLLPVDARAVRTHAVAATRDGELWLLRAQPKADDGGMWWSIDRLTSAEEAAGLHIDEMLDRVVRGTATTKSALRVGAATEEVPPRVHVAVVTTGGDVHTRSMEDAWVGSLDIAVSKAFAAMAFSSDENALTTRSLQHLAHSPDAQLQGIGHSNPEFGVVTFPGGLPVYVGGVLWGGIGVSGDAVNVDEALARMGLAKEFRAPKAIRINTVTGGKVPYTAGDPPV
ncbi:hypothetical protein LCGC14_1847860, partial [marine sediment metagenome]